MLIWKQKLLLVQEKVFRNCCVSKETKLVQIWLLLPLKKWKISGKSESLILNWAEGSNSAKFNTENITAEKIFCPVTFNLSDSTQGLWLVKIQSILKGKGDVNKLLEITSFLKHWNKTRLLIGPLSRQLVQGLNSEGKEKKLKAFKWRDEGRIKGLKRST